MVKQLMDENKNRRDDECGSTPSRNPFTDEILNDRYPKMLAMPTIPSYDRTKDPKPNFTNTVGTWTE